MGSYSLERETGIEPATNSLEGCDSTIELLPPKTRSVRATFPIRDRPLRRNQVELAEGLEPPTV